MGLWYQQAGPTSPSPSQHHPSAYHTPHTTTSPRLDVLPGAITPPDPGGQDNGGTSSEFWVRTYPIGFVYRRKNRAAARVSTISCQIFHIRLPGYIKLLVPCFLRTNSLQTSQPRQNSIVLQNFPLQEQGTATYFTARWNSTPCNIKSPTFPCPGQSFKVNPKNHNVHQRVTVHNVYIIWAVWRAEIFKSSRNFCSKHIQPERLNKNFSTLELLKELKLKNPIGFVGLSSVIRY